MPDPDHVKKIPAYVPWPRELAEDWGLVDPAAVADPEPTPIERALAILRPHLSDEPLYRPTA